VISQSFRIVGQTTKLSVTDTGVTSGLIKTTSPDQTNYAAFLNTGSKPCAVTFSTNDAGVDATLPATNPGDFVLPGNMIQPIAIVVPAVPYYVAAITASGETATLYVTPIGN
jgi:hypothetical protein